MVGSTLLKQSIRKLLVGLQTTPERLQTSVQLALTGYDVMRAWRLSKIAARVHLNEASLAIILALQRRIAAICTVAADKANIPIGLQVLWHLLMGIPHTMLGLTTLPNGWYWVLVRLRQAGITTLADLIAADPLLLTVHIKHGLFGCSGRKRTSCSSPTTMTKQRT